ncbi:hypothetical protein [Allorhizocola rhizosphaerae]|uniref:hypothetical protein n=1 Tax=Allorhizocola rhizosphaerae TaxID=1872709 RepID=UPI0013C33A1D|nr:hypothetical protein [Allorhizocola rhizosphaerae]
MSGQRCGQCPVLQAEIVRLRARVAQLERLVAFWQGWLGWLRGAVDATVRWMDKENAQPTMSRAKQLQAVYQRLTDTLDQLNKGVK